MIKANFKKENGIITNIKINGHAMYDEYGKDIVCSAVSSALTLTVNTILKFDINAIKYNKSNNFNLENIKKDDITNKILESFLEMLKSIEEEYKENIRVKEE